MDAELVVDSTIADVIDVSLASILFRTLRTIDSISAVVLILGVDYS